MHMYTLLTPALPQPTAANALSLVRWMGATGVASALETGMLAENAGAVVKIVRGALPPDQTPWELGATLFTYDKVPRGLSSHFNTTALPSALRRHATPIDYFVNTFKPRDNMRMPHPGRVAYPGPAEGDALDFLKRAGVEGLAAGIQTVMFGPPAVSTAFRVLQGALRMINAIPNTKDSNFLNVFSSFDSFTRLLFDSLNMHVLLTYAAVLERNKVDLNSAVAGYHGGKTPEDQFLYVRIDDLDLPVQTINLLKKAGIKYVGQLSEMTPDALLKLRGIDTASVSEIRMALANLPGITLGTAIRGLFDPARIQRRYPTYPVDQSTYPKSESTYKAVPLLLGSLTELNLSRRTMDRLQQAGIQCIGDLCHKTEEELLGNPIRIGRLAFKDILFALAGVGLFLGMRMSLYPTDPRG